MLYFKNLMKFCDTITGNLCDANRERNRQNRELTGIAAKLIKPSDKQVRLDYHSKMAVRRPSRGHSLVVIFRQMIPTGFHLQLCSAGFRGLVGYQTLASRPRRSELTCDPLIVRARRVS